MEGVKIMPVISLLATVLFISVNGQITTPCSVSMISTFTPCLNFVTGSTSNGSSPSSDCCGSLKYLMSASMDCACLVIAANVPLQLPVNRTLALSLPRACNLPGVPVQCKASGSPLPAPGPVPIFLGPTPSPTASSPLTSQASKASALAPAPEPETTLPFTPAESPQIESEAPAATTTPGIRPVVNPSASNPSCVSPPLIFLLFIGALAFSGC